jgi:hypothetical protein
MNMTEPLNEKKENVGLSDSNAGLCVTDEMIDSYIAFVEKTTYLHHPDVPYMGTENGDSTEAWIRRYSKAAIMAALQTE